MIEQIEKLEDIQRELLRIGTVQTESEKLDMIARDKIEDTLTMHRQVLEKEANKVLDVLWTEISTWADGSIVAVLSLGKAIVAVKDGMVTVTADRTNRASSPQ